METLLADLRLGLRMLLKAPINGLTVMQTIPAGGELRQVQKGDQLFPGMMFMSIVDPKDYPARSLRKDDDVDGSGPYKVQSYDEGKQAVLVANSGDGGKTWASVRIAQGSGNFGSVGTVLDKEYVAAWGNGNAIVTWGNYPLGHKGSFSTAAIYIPAPS